MKQLHSYLLWAALLCILPLSTAAQSIELQAITDFTNLNSGEVPYYIDDAGERNALAINAADPALRNKFARAEHVFTGTDGLYDITINALGEIDGDGAYRLLVNGVVQGELVNSPVTVDYTVIEHLFQAIALTNQDVIGVESKAVSNDMIPEGDGFAFARGRWRSLALDIHMPEVLSIDASADLELSLTKIDASDEVGQQTSFAVNVTNNANANTATAPIINVSLPDEVEFISSDTCVITESGVQCVLSNLAPEQTTSVRFSASINAVGSIEVSASVSADQVDNDLTNNTDTLMFEAVSPMTTVVDMPTDAPQNPNDTEITSTTSEMNNESGSVGIVGLLALILIGVFRRKINVTCKIYV